METQHPHHTTLVYLCQVFRGEGKLDMYGEARFTEPTDPQDHPLVVLDYGNSWHILGSGGYQPFLSDPPDHPPHQLRFPDL